MKTNTTAPLAHVVLALVACAFVAGCQTSGDGSDEPADNGAASTPSQQTLSVAVSGAGRIVSSPAGIDCTGSCSASFAEGTSVVLTQTAGNNASFDGWSGDCSGAGGCTVTLTRSVSVSAAFQANTASNNPPVAPPAPAPAPLPPIASAALYAPAPSTLAVQVTLHPGPSVAAGSSQPIVFGIPLAPGWLQTTDRIRVEDASGTVLAANTSELARWRTFPGSTVIPDSVRAIAVALDYRFASNQPETITVSFDAAPSPALGRSLSARDTWTATTSGVDPAEYSVALQEPRVYATLPADWLSAALLRSRTVSIGASNGEWSQFDEAFVSFGRTFVNDVEAEVNSSEYIDYETQAAPWLYDRTNSLFGLYIRTGDVKWLRHAHRSAAFYASRLSTRGTFDLKSFDDLKYSFGYSLLNDLLLTGDTELLPKIEAVASFALTWDERYNPNGNFWTERHTTYALAGRLAAWEATGDVRYANAARDLVNELVAEASNPQLGVAPIGCIQHTMRQHEGDNDDRPVCSPWMSSLLSEALWRFYILTADQAALSLMASLGDFVAEHGVYTASGVSSTIDGLTLPWYLASATVEFSDSGPYADLEHGCDVASLASRAAFAKRRLGADDSALRVLTMELLATCYFSLDYWHRVGSHTASGRPQWRLAPPRKYSWWFGTASDLAWLESN